MTDTNDVKFWQDRYNNGYTGWDLGGVSPPLQAYFEQLTDKNARILIAGAGNCHEAIYLHTLGFDQVYVIDFVASVLDKFAKTNPDFNDKHLICHDFFKLNQLDIAPFDVVIEQTFLCAIDPNRREEYAKQMYRLLKKGGKLVGVLFDCDFDSSPPFGGSLAEYRTLFSSLFDIQIMEQCYNSVKPRVGRELFIKLIKT